MKQDNIRKKESILFRNELNNHIGVESFYSEEYQELNRKKLVELYGKQNSLWKCYLFTSRLCFYPLSFNDKYKKVWKWYEDIYNLEYKEAIEKGKEFERFFVYYGVAEIDIEQFTTALDIVKENFMNSFLLLSRESRDLNELLKHYSLLNKSYEMDYDMIISTECRKDNRIIKIVVGNNGASIDHFFKRRLSEYAEKERKGI